MQMDESISMQMQIWKRACKQYAEEDEESTERSEEQLFSVVRQSEPRRSLSRAEQRVLDPAQKVLATDCVWGGQSLAWHSIQVANQREIRVETHQSEQAIQEGVQEALLFMNDASECDKKIKIFLNL